MVYIYKKIIGKKPYYYLRISKKVKDKEIVKDIAYLGDDIAEVQRKLDSLPSYKSEIRNSYRNIKRFIESEYYLKKIKEKKLKKNQYISKELLEEIEAIKLHYNDRFLKLDGKTKEEVYTNFLVDFAFNTTSIEGNTITLLEAYKLLKEDLTPNNRTLREIYDLQNTEKVFFEILKTKRDLNHDFIIDIHDNLLENIDKRKGYRTEDIRVFKSKFDPSPARYVKADMEIILKQYKENKDKMHPLLLAGMFHHKFEKIHPFFDGNGRTGRILMNYIMIKNDYPPFLIKKSRRDEYMDSMSKADNLGLNEVNQKDYGTLMAYLASEMIQSYWNSFLV